MRRGRFAGTPGMAGVARVCGQKSAKQNSARIARNMRVQCRGAICDVCGCAAVPGGSRGGAESAEKEHSGRKAFRCSTREDPDPFPRWPHLHAAKDLMLHRVRTHDPRLMLVSGTGWESREGAKGAKAGQEKEFLSFASFVSSRDNKSFERISRGSGGWGHSLVHKPRGRTAA